jgi:dimeric dUTPase (all-alpha-NTP-PPase superfamily)
MTEAQHDMLASIFRMQTELNDYVFKKNLLTDRQGGVLTMRTIFDSVERGELMVNDLPNTWLSNYSKAMNDELKELGDELLWKWWSRDKIDIQNIRVELIDILHFLISAMVAAGLSAERVFAVYQQKHAVNFTRQDTGYSKVTKSDDNRGIG